MNTKTSLFSHFAFTYVPDAVSICMVEILYNGVLGSISL